MFFVRKAIRTTLLVLLGTALSGQSPSPDAHFHALIPLGAEAYDLQGEKWKSIITLLASAESPQFEGVVRRGVNEHAALFSADGKKSRTILTRFRFA